MMTVLLHQYGMEYRLVTRDEFAAFGLKCGRGEKASGWATIGELSSGTPIQMPIRILHGATAGPAVGLSGMVHGDEYNGFQVINRIFDELDPRQVRGSIIGIPVANPIALLNNSRISQLEYERLNLNRVFPGNARGFQMERLADLIFREGVLQSDVWLDFHEGGRDFVARYLIVGAEGDRLGVDEDLQLARWFGQGIPITAVAVTADQVRLARLGAITVQARLAGKRALGIELGGGGSLIDEYVEQGTLGTRNVLAALGMIPGGAPMDGDAQLVSYESTWPRPKHGGFFEQAVALGETVDGGQTLGHVRNLLGEVVEEIVAPFRSVITDIRHTPTIQTGEWTVKCARLSDE